MRLIKKSNLQNNSLKDEIKIYVAYLTLLVLGIQKLLSYG